MQEIRQGFHALANELNKISVTAGIVVETVNIEEIEGMEERKVKEELKKALEALTVATDSALKAGELMSKLRKRIYSELKIDTSKPVE